jgi:type I restriction enzyme, S subunit
MARCDELEKLRTDRTQKRTTVHTAAIDRLLNAKDDRDFSQAWSFITQHFSELYSVKENVTELRKVILQLAVMGKLVPQDPNDEPASELLKAIGLEKLRLVKEGKIKQSKPLLEIKLEEVPYLIPERWQWVRVIDIVDVGTGSTPATTNSDYYNGNIPWYTSSATNNIIAETPETFITEIAIKETNCKIFPSGSLIIAMYGQGKTRGQISEIVVPGATNQAIAAMVFYESSKELKKYIKYYFVKIYDEIRSMAEGAAQPNLNVGKIKETLIPLPPLAEQHRIVAKIDRLMEFCDRLEESIEATKVKQTDLLNAVMAQV